MENRHQICETKEAMKEDAKGQFAITLPMAKGFLGPSLYLHQGFWCPSRILPNVISFQTHFHPKPNDILLATHPKSGTTWLKALSFSILNRTRFSMFHNHPLLVTNPHELVPFLEFNVYTGTNTSPTCTMDSWFLDTGFARVGSDPRLFSTHIPYKAIPESIKDSTCRVVYLCRNPLDTVVSFWEFAKRERAELLQESSLDEYLDYFCKGVVGFGPFWDHMLSYWKASLERPNKVLFLKYEDMKEDNVKEVIRLAEFLGFPFTLDEVKEGVVEEICKLCSLENLKGLEVNKKGKFMPRIRNEMFFRKGEVGDWVNHLRPCMADKLVKLMQEKFDGSGLSFRVSPTEKLV